MPEIGGGGVCSPVADGSLGHVSPTADPCVCEGWPFVGGVVFVSDRGAVDTTVLLGEVVGVLGVGVSSSRPPPRFSGGAAPCERVLRSWKPWEPFCPFADIIR